MSYRNAQCIRKLSLATRNRISVQSTHHPRLNCNVDPCMKDIYYRKAKELGYRARSAYKLLQIAEHFPILEPNVTRVVDLCAAPGGWTEVVSQVFAKQRQASAGSDGSSNGSSSSTSAVPAASTHRLIAVDLQSMQPLPGVTFIKGDLTRTATAIQIQQALQGSIESSEPVAISTSSPPAQSPTSTSASASSSSSFDPASLAHLVLCDGAPDVIGLHDIDECIQFELLLAAYNISLHILSEGGHFVAKIFRGKFVQNMYGLFRRHFNKVTISKPKCCRNSSIEGFVVCEGFKGLSPEDRVNRGLDNPFNLNDVDPEAMKEPVPFVSCWDEEKLDSDRSYPLSFKLQGSAARSSDAAQSTDSSMNTSTYHSLTPSAQPIDPPYKRSLQMKKQNKFQTSNSSQ